MTKQLNKWFVLIACIGVGAILTTIALAAVAILTAIITS